jgi:Fe-S oxidoreductase
MPLGQPAVREKNDKDIASAKSISREFIAQNYKRAKELGARSIVLFCSACEPTYSNYKEIDDLEVISYTELLDRFLDRGKLDLSADYYAGCYRFRRKITSAPLDIEPPKKIFDRIEGLKVNHLNPNYCCYIPPHLENLVGDIQTQTVITICTGCYYNLRRTLEEKGGCEVKMLTEIVWQSIENSR